MIFHLDPLGVVVQNDDPTGDPTILVHERSDGGVDHAQVPAKLESALVEPEDLGMSRGVGPHSHPHFPDKVFGKHLGNPLADDPVLGDPHQGLHLRVPALNPLLQVHDHHPDADGFDDALTVFLELPELLRLLVYRGVQPGILQGDGHIAGDGLKKFHVLAGEQVAPMGPPQSQVGNGFPFGDTGKIVVQPELFQSFTMFRPLSHETPEVLVEQKALGQGGVAGIQIAQVQVVGLSGQAHRLGQAELLGAALLPQKNGHLAHRKSRADFFGHRLQQPGDVHLRAQLLSELDQGLAVVVAIPVEVLVHLGLNPVAQGHKGKTGHHHRDHRVPVDGLGSSRLEHLADDGEQPQVEAHVGQRGQRRGHALLEDDVHIHEAELDDGVPEGQRDQHQRQHRDLHPDRGDDSHPVGNGIDQEEGEGPDDGSHHDPLHLLPQDLVGAGPVGVGQGQHAQDEQTGEMEHVKLIQ